MKVADLTIEDKGRRFTVTGVAFSEAEQMGFINDTERLMGQSGVIEDAVVIGTECTQAHVKWDEAGPGHLSLSHGDEIDLASEDEANRKERDV